MSGDSATARAALAQLVDGFAGRHAWVVGDLMLDEYLHGRVERVSPEAPVPVVVAERDEFRPGGAANVARQLATLGARSRLAGVVGRDDAAGRLLEHCTAAGIDVAAIERTAGRTTPRKLRVLGADHQLLRIDWEDVAPCSAADARRVVERLAAGPRPEVVILSDYAKGTLSPEMVAGASAAARAAGARVLVDPKRRDLAAYRGAQIVTPNLHELEAACGGRRFANDAEIVAAARAQCVEHGFEAMLVTLGPRGMIVVPATGDPSTLEAERRAVFDVTGAGDTVIAVLALGLAAGAPLVDAARVANAAAGLAVAEIGAVAIAPAALRETLAGRPASKLLSRAELAERVRTWQAAGRRVVMTNGCFDLLHAGHLTVLHEAARLGDALVVAINSDASVRRLKGPERPLVPEQERAALLAALDCVDAVTIFDEDTPLELLAAATPDVLVKGADYTVERVVGREFVESRGGRVALVPLLPEKSTTALVERIRRST
jgi:D-beta-D-heptose 7-phosphate kinase/D-beta-D-heptose 1-phosphate adenosyltransferase